MYRSDYFKALEFCFAFVLVVFAMFEIIDLFTFGSLHFLLQRTQPKHNQNKSASGHFCFGCVLHNVQSRQPLKAQHLRNIPHNISTFEHLFRFSCRCPPRYLLGFVFGRLCCCVGSKASGIARSCGMGLLGDFKVCLSAKSKILMDIRCRIFCSVSECKWA